jgi:phosphoribosylglycinamide formyltransferase-1
VVAAQDTPDERTQVPDTFQVRRDGSAPLRVVVLISGQGSNLAALLQACAGPDFPVTVVAVAADRSGAGGLDLAERSGVPTFVERVTDHPDRASWDRALTDRIVAYRPDLVVSAGFLKLVGPVFLAQFAGRFLNTHNALLPAFPGMHGPRDALAYGVKIAGATLFVVDDGVDTGPIVAQVAVPVTDDDTVETLTERIKVAERAQLVQAVGRMARQGWTISGRTVSIP